MQERIDTKERPWIKDAITKEKVVFLNAANLEILKGYKATVVVHGRLFGYKELHVIITGVSGKGALKIFDDLKAMDPKEVKGV